MRTTQNIILGILFALLTPLVTYAGDYPWWIIKREYKIWGVGEINGRILLYLGNTQWISPSPYQDFLILLAILGFLTLLAFIYLKVLVPFIGHSKR